MSSTEVELYQPGGFLALNHQTDEIVEAIRMAVGEDGQASKFNLTQARVPGPGGKRWKVRYGSGKEDDPETLTGVIVALQPSRSYWKQAYESGGDPPDCASHDGGKTGIGDPGGECVVCPMNQWGSAPNNGKACRETREILLLPTDNALPILVTAPPVSLTPLSGFLLEEAGKRHPYNTFVVELGIGKRNTKNRTDVPCIAAEFKGMLNDEERDLAKAYADQLATIFARNAMNPNGTDPAAPASAFTAGETDEERAERLADKYGDSIPEE